MGQRMEDIPIDYGDDCPQWPGPGKTPKYLYVRFSQIIKCPPWNETEYEIPPNDRVFKLTQHELHPCLWTYSGTAWFVFLEVPVEQPRMNFYLQSNTTGVLYFTNFPTEPPTDGYIFHNELACDDILHGGTCGIAVVTWTPQATALLEAINLAKGYDLFMELFPLENGRLVYKFCRLQDATNIKILFQP